VPAPSQPSITRRPGPPRGLAACPSPPPAPAYASRRVRRQLVHIAPWDASDCRRTLCGAFLHRWLAPTALAAVTCPLCLRLWDRGYRRRATILRRSRPDVAPVAVNA
jgi:hypothetical protein